MIHNAGGVGSALEVPTHVHAVYQRRTARYGYDVRSCMAVSTAISAAIAIRID